MIRRANPKDLPAILAIVAEARAFLKASGIPQWQDEYPNQATFEADLALQQLYVWQEGSDGDAIDGLGVIQVLPDHNYDEIEGEWLSQGQAYVSFHRLALHPRTRGKGAASRFLLELEAVVRANLSDKKAIRVDTHRLNLPMQKTLKKVGYSYTGIVYLDNGELDNERLAFEKLI